MRVFYGGLRRLARKHPVPVIASEARQSQQEGIHTSQTVINMQQALKNDYFISLIP
jgi:hypothetical protein